VVSGRQTGVRNFLSRELILEAAFRVVDADVMNEITMSRLGRELDADPSAVYRHFRNKDELLLAMADVMLEESMNSYVEGDAPVENLHRMCWTLRRSYLRRPGLARAVASRFTGGAAEAASVAHMLENMAQLGYDQDEAIANARALAELTLGHIIMTADVLALPVKTQAFELEMGRSYYTYPRTPGPAVTPAEQRAAHLEDGEQVFGVMIDMFLAGLVARAPRGG
jgi:AcrR family transcriptional regulator